MGIPKKYVGHYRSLASHLTNQGFFVYPYEILCYWLQSPHPRNKAVDVGAKKGADLYAFEYKSSHDSIKRAIFQVENYRVNFDYVIVVAEIPRKDCYLSGSIRRMNKYIQTLVSLGAGIWTIRKKIDGWEVEEVNTPERQKPLKLNRDYMLRKFMRAEGLKCPTETEVSHALWEKRKVTTLDLYETVRI